MDRRNPGRWLKMIGPGILVAATGVGAGDLATGAFSGSILGPAILWAVLVGAGLKFVLTEGLARWQLVTGETFLEGSVRYLGKPVQYVFLVYMLFWSYFVGSALMSACGVTAEAIFPGVLPRPITLTNAAGQESVLISAKILFGLLQSAIAVVLVRCGGFRLFERIMSVCIGVMFVTVVVTAILVQPDWATVISGLLIPQIPHADGQGLSWTIALMGGVGGTLTILCYGYWIREEGRISPNDLAVSRIDLATGYIMTALFGIAMVIIGSQIEVQGKGSKLIVDLAHELESHLGEFGAIGRWAFLIGAWGAVFSSLLGVWQSVPYLFADFCKLAWSPAGDNKAQMPVDTSSRGYRGFLYALATIPAVGLWGKFETVQKVYAIFGAAFIPLLGIALLILNGRSKLIGEKYRNSLLTNAILLAAIGFFILAGWLQLQAEFFPNLVKPSAG